MREFSIAILALILTLGLMFAVACGEDDDDEVICEYDAVGELCQQAYDCCGQFVTWAEAQGYPGYEQISCKPYICITTPEARCQDMLDQALQVEGTYGVDFPDCN